MGRIVSVLLVAMTIAVNVFAATALLYDLGIEQTQWRQPFWGLGQIYGAFVEHGYSGASGWLSDRFGVALPPWSAHLVVLYASTAFAVGASGIGVARRDNFTGGAASSGLSIAWPLAVLFFVWKAIRLKIVSRFARDHSLILMLYVLATVGAYGAARYVNANVLSGEPVTAASIKEYEIEQAQLGMPIVLLRDPRKQGRRIAVLTDDWLYCYPPDSKLYRVPRGYLTDFASIPKAARVIFNPFGDHAEAAVIHDWLYAVGETGRRPYADQVFLYAMAEQGVNLAARRTMYRSVRMGGNAAYGANREWTFYDPVSFEPFTPPIEKPSAAAVATVSCETFETEYFALKEKYRTY